MKDPGQCAQGHTHLLRMPSSLLLLHGLLQPSSPAVPEKTMDPFQGLACPEQLWDSPRKRSVKGLFHPLPISQGHPLLPPSTHKLLSMLEGGFPTPLHRT